MHAELVGAVSLVGQEIKVKKTRRAFRSIRINKWESRHRATSRIWFRASWVYTIKNVNIRRRLVIGCKYGGAAREGGRARFFVSLFIGTEAVRALLLESKNSFRTGSMIARRFNYAWARLIRHRKSRVQSNLHPAAGAIITYTHRINPAPTSDKFYFNFYDRLTTLISCLQCCFLIIFFFWHYFCL